MKQVIFAAVALAVAQAASAQDAELPEATFETYEEFAASVLEGVTPENGSIALARAPVLLDVQPEFDFYDAQESRTILEDLWGNPPDTSVLGMVFPAGESPAVAPWGAVLTYEDTGYVSDEDAASLDAAELMSQMQRDSRLANQQREKLGYGTVDLVGWAVAPEYDAEHHRIDWAKDLVFSDAGGEHTLNYDMRVLGRRGVLSINFVGTMSDIDSIRAAAPQVLDIPEFTEGERYADYKAGDKKAGYGVAALITGGVAAAAAKKTGLLAIGLIFLKKGWIIVLAAFGVVAGWIRRMFGGGAQS